MAEIKISPAVIDITMPMAVTNQINYVFTKRDKVTPIDISTAIIYFTVKDVESDANTGDTGALIKKELSITDGPAGKAKLFLTHIDTFIPASKYFYDIKIIQTYPQSDTIVDVALIGTFTVVDNRTNRVVGVS